VTIVMEKIRSVSCMAYWSSVIMLWSRPSQRRLNNCYFIFLADRTVGCTFGTLSNVCRLWRFVLWRNGMS